MGYVQGRRLVTGIEESSETSKSSQLLSHDRLAEVPVVALPLYQPDDPFADPLASGYEARARITSVGAEF
jgi:hypothetical protein